jgi:hypothetical protein
MQHSNWGESHCRYVLKLRSEELQGSSGITWFGAFQVELPTSNNLQIMVFIGQGGGRTALGTSIWPSHPVVASVPLSSPGEKAKTVIADVLQAHHLDNAEAAMRLYSSEGGVQNMFSMIENLETYGGTQSDASFEAED